MSVNKKNYYSSTNPILTHLLVAINKQPIDQRQMSVDWLLGYKLGNYNLRLNIEAGADDKGYGNPLTMFMRSVNIIPVIISELYMGD